MPKTRAVPDIWILTPTLLILAIGVMMVYSASAVLALHDFGDSFYYLKRQLAFAVLGIAGMVLMMNVDYRVWKKYAVPGLVVAFVLLVIVLIPGIGVVRGGARSWLGISSFGIQPSEFAKLAILLFLAKMLSDQTLKIKSFTKGLMPPLLCVGAAFGLIMLQPDLGTGAVLVGASLVVIYTAGAKISHLMGLAMIGVAGFIGLIVAAPY